MERLWIALLLAGLFARGAGADDWSVPGATPLLQRVQFSGEDIGRREESWIGLTTYSREKVEVQAVKSMDCVPTAIFNALNLGTPDLNKTIANLEGGDLHEKYLAFMQRVARKPSENFRRTVPRTRQYDWGTAIGDVRFMFLDALDIAKERSLRYRGGYVPRFNGEAPGRATQRIHAEFLRSLAKGVPPVLGYARYEDDSRRMGHYVTVLAVTDRIQKGSFGVRYFDPELGQVLTLRAQEEDKMGFTAYKMDLLAAHASPVAAELKSAAGNAINSPFLKLRRENQAVPDRPGTFLILEQLFGDIENNQIDDSPVP